MIDDLLQKGFIRESKSPYGACVIPVLKKNGPFVSRKFVLKIDCLLIFHIYLVF